MKTLLLITVFLALFAFSAAQFEQEIDDYLDFAVSQGLTEDEAQALFFGKLKDAFNKAKSAVSKAANKVKNSAVGIVNKIKDSVTGIKPSDFLPRAGFEEEAEAQALFFGKLLDAFTKTKNKVSNTVNNVKNTAKDKQSVINLLKKQNLVSGLPFSVKFTEEEVAQALFFGKLKRAFRKVKSKVSGAVRKVKGKVSGAVKKVKGRVSGIAKKLKLPTNLKSVFKKLPLSKVKELLKKGPKGLLKQAKGAIGGAIAGDLPIPAIGLTEEEVAQVLFLGKLKKAINKAKNKVSSTVNKLKNQAVDKFHDVVNGARDGMSKLDNLLRSIRLEEEEEEAAALDYEEDMYD